ncbi:hypothetical protein ILUMI_20576 [Ignelater luminosus]|uniref:Uncharacterized protein n=1 Tax=Ignelater luminosus TaxID=2038154 RepID=A0A8K0CKE8_IGNLU|nr:hypothetical protein ILUMI_20576 [Ignelater luminosus]
MGEITWVLTKFLQSSTKVYNCPEDYLTISGIVKEGRNAVKKTRYQAGRQTTVTSRTATKSLPEKDAELCATEPGQEMKEAMTETASTVYDVLEERSLAEKTEAFVFDITAPTTDRLNDACALLEQELDRNIVAFAKTTVQEKLPREDYKELLEHVIKVLGGTLSRGISFRRPYSMAGKGNLLSQNKSEETALREICCFNDERIEHHMRGRMAQKMLQEESENEDEKSDISKKKAQSFEDITSFLTKQLPDDLITEKSKQLLKRFNILRYLLELDLSFRKNMEVIEKL